MHALKACIFALVLVSSGANAVEVRQISLATKDIIYDRVTRKIYASVPSTAGSIGNSITVIDPLSGVIGPSVFLGSEPGKLAISDDGQYLYVALDGAAAVRRFHIPTLTAGLQFSLGADSFFGPMYAEDIAVLPGNPEAVAVSRKFLGISPRHAGVAIYDDGVQRSTATPGHTGSNVIEASNTASRLYGYNNETTEYGFRRMSVTPSGVTVLDSTPNLISNFGVDIAFDAGRIYATTGRVIDAEARTLLGTFSGISFGALVRPDSTLGRTFFVSGNRILTFDSNTFILLDSLDVPGVSGTPGSLIRWGVDGLAFRTSSDQVFLIATALSPGSPVCGIQMSKASYFNGETVIAQTLQVTNPTASPLAVEFKLWFVAPGSPPSSFARGGHDDSFVLPAGSSQNFGPLPLFTVQPTFPRGAYSFNCRLVHPVTGEQLTEDLNSFSIQ